jgi:hypothetical protein
MIGAISREKSATAQRVGAQVHNVHSVLTCTNGEGPPSFDQIRENAADGAGLANATGLPATP